jgi:hypothetical protein
MYTNIGQIHCSLAVASEVALCRFAILADWFLSIDR